MTNLEISNEFPDLCIWIKDVNLRFIDINETAAYVFGFDHRRNAIGKTDFDIPCRLANFAKVFRENDFQVLKTGKLIKFLEIQPCVNNEWKILHVVKKPYYRNGLISGVIGYSVDITKTYMRLEKFLVDQNSYENKSKYCNFPNSYFENLNLSSREEECLFFLLRHCTAKEIARILNLSHRTIEIYIQQLKFKFDCKSKAELYLKTKELGFFKVIPPSLIQKQLSLIID